MDETVVLAFVVGAFFGLLAGRVWAEIFRARFDMQQTWRKRRNYRAGEQRYFLPALVIAAVFLAVYLFGSS